MNRINQERAGSLQANLDSEISNTAVPKKGKKKGMATELTRIRVKTGEAEDGTPLYKKVNGHTQPELADNIVREYIRNGRIWEFMTPQQVEAMQTTPTVKEYAVRWMEVFKKPKLKETTYVNYSKYINDYIVPSLGDKMLHQITTADIQQMLIQYQHLAKHTLKEVKAILCQMIEFAREEYPTIGGNPCKSKLLFNPSDKVEERKALTLEEAQDIISNLHVLKWEDAMLIAIPMYTGLRRGEVLGLQWEDIDSEKGIINVQRNVTHPGGNQPVITTPKTEAGKRVVPLSEELQKLFDGKKGKGYILGGEKPITLTCFRHAWERITKQIDLHGATLHSLRHTYITLASTETDIKTLQGVAGHSTVTMTMDRYAHTQTNKVLELGRKMDSIYSSDGHGTDTKSNPASA
ncbi:MAG: site-specific integrase [Clostridia bacterium]|nr:site-specific integrase [Clostridia bacterium]